MSGGWLDETGAISPGGTALTKAEKADLLRRADEAERLANQATSRTLAADAMALAGDLRTKAAH